MNESAFYTLATVVAAAAVTIRGGCIINMIRPHDGQGLTAPVPIAVGLVGITTAAACEVIAPLWGVRFDWRDLLMHAPLALFLWCDRRRPVRQQGVIA